jgi:hypothetical protein
LFFLFWKEAEVEGELAVHRQEACPTRAVKRPLLFKIA